MPFNGSGVFSRIYSWTTDALNGLDISPSRMDTDSNDIASGLTQCITKNGQSTPTANLPMGGYKLTGLAAGSSSGDSVNYGQLQAATTGLTVSNVASARLLTPKTTGLGMVIVQGYTTPGDGGGGTYTYVATDTTSADNGGSILVASDGGRLHLLVQPSVSAVQFGADPTGVSDSSPAVQAAINALAATGGTITFPSGTFRFNSSLNWTNSTNNSIPGITFSGAGSGIPGRSSGGTVFKSYIANGPLFNVQGTWTGNGGTGNTFAVGGGINNVTIDGSNATGTSQAISSLGWWEFAISNITIQNFPGDGITFYASSGYGGIFGSDGDYTASAFGVIERGWIYNCAGTGINCSTSGGTFSNTNTGLRFKQLEVQYCGTGALITGTGTSLEDVTFSGTGFIPGSSSTRGSGISLIVGTLSQGRPAGVWFQDVAFDFALTSHVSLVNCENIWWDASCQMIFRDLNGAGATTGTMTPPNGFTIAPDSASETVVAVFCKSMNVRANTPRTFTAFNCGYASNVQGIEITDVVFADGNYTGPLTLTAAPSGTTSATLSAAFTGTTGTYLVSFSQGQTRAATLTNGSASFSWTGAVTDSGTTVHLSSNVTLFGGALTSSNYNLTNDFHLVSGGVSNTTVPQESPAPLVPGRPLPGYLGSSLVATSLTAGSFVTIPFDTQDTTNASIYPSYGTNGAPTRISFYSTVTHQFTAPSSAYYEISGTLQVASTTTGDTIRIQIYCNGSSYEVCQGPGGSTSTGNMTFTIPRTILYCPAGGTIYVQAESVSNTRALSTSVPSRLNIEMLGDYK